jgi:hypothetical protein
MKWGDGTRMQLSVNCRAYMHAAQFWNERVAMMHAWSDYLDDLRESGKVIPLVKAR